MDKRKMVIICAMLIALGAAAGGFIVHKFFPRTVTIVETKVETKVETEVVVQEKVITKTEIAYVPKEVDPETGEKEKTDVQVDIKQPKVNVKVNGEEYYFKLDQKEDKKFKDGKIVFNQTGEIKLDIKTEDPKLIKIDAFCGDGYGLSVNYKKLTLDIDLQDIKKPKIDRVKYRLLGI